MTASATPARWPEPQPPADPASRLDALGIRAAPIGRRAAAFALDALVSLVFLALQASGVAGVLAQRSLAGLPIALVISGVALGIAWGITLLILQGRLGWTPGKRALGLRVIRMATLTRPGWWILLRTLVVQVAGSIVPLLGSVLVLLSSTWGPRHRGWHDLVAGTLVIDVRSGLDPLDDAALAEAGREREQPDTPDTPPRISLATGATDAVRLQPADRSRAAVVGAMPVGPPPAPAATTPPVRVATATPATSATPAMATLPPPVRGTATAAAPTPAVVLIAPDGSAHPIDTVLVLGRNPSAQPGERAVTLTDPAFSMSKTHARVGLDGGAVFVEDLGSTNGTALVGPDGAVRTLTARQRVRVELAAVIRLGDVEVHLR